MPEGLEAEIWRLSMECLCTRTITDVWIDDRVADAQLVALLPGCVIEAVRRRGKVVVVDTDGPSVGLHFGMTGRVVVDGIAPIERLEYASGADRSDWDRLRIRTVPGPPVDANGRDVAALRVNDPRRLGRISLDPDARLDSLGVDMFEVTPDVLGAAFGRRRAAVKTTLLDQHVVAGLGNLCADEVLWWAGVAPHRGVDTLSIEEVERMSKAMRQRLPIMLRSGGSTTGTLSPARRSSGSTCPRDGAALQRTTIGGRTAVWCPVHQQ